MPNERLRSSITAAGHSYETLADQIGVDRKTVERWVTMNRVPHRTHRWKSAELLSRDEAYLWPAVLEEPRTQAASEAEFVHLFPNRGAVPRELWRGLFVDATDAIDVLAYAGLFLLDSEPDLADVLVRRAAEGVRVRLLIGDPDSDAVALRGDEEGIEEGMAERTRMARTYLRPAFGAPGVEVRQHSTTLYNSIYRSGGTMLVNTHIYGSPAGASPVLHLQRVAGGRVFDSYQRSFERVWDSATVIETAVGGRQRRR